MQAALKGRRSRFNHFKGYFEPLGLGHAYHDAWWRMTAYKKTPLTQWNYEHQAIFVHVPKTAGLSIYEMLGMEPPYDTHAPVAAYRQADRALFEKAFKFAVVRNPWDRLVSAFHHLKYGTTISDRMPWDEDRWWAERYLSEINSFAEFLRALQTSRFRWQVLTWRHFIPQYYFLTENRSGLLVNQLIRFENIDAELPGIARNIGLPIAATRQNATEHGHYRHYYDEEGYSVVRAIYARDIDLFQYGF